MNHKFGEFVLPLYRDGFHVSVIIQNQLRSALGRSHESAHDGDLAAVLYGGGVAEDGIGGGHGSPGADDRVHQRSARSIRSTRFRRSYTVIVGDILCSPMRKG